MGGKGRQFFLLRPLCIYHTWNKSSRVVEGRLHRVHVCATEQFFLVCESETSLWACLSVNWSVGRPSVFRLVGRFDIIFLKDGSLRFCVFFQGQGYCIRIIIHIYIHVRPPETILVQIPSVFFCAQSQLTAYLWQSLDRAREEEHINSKFYVFTRF